MRFPSGWKATAVTTEPTSIRRACRRSRVVHDRAAVEPPHGEPLAVAAERHVGGQVGRTAQRRSDRLLSAHVPDDRRAQVRAHQGPAVRAERDVVDRARVGRQRGAVRLAGLRVPHEDRALERRRGQQPSIGTEVQRGGRLVADRQRPADRSARCDVDHGHRAGVVARDHRPAVRRRRSPSSTSALPITSGLPTRRPVATSQIPTVSGSARVRRSASNPG